MQEDMLPIWWWYNVYYKDAWHFACTHPSMELGGFPLRLDLDLAQA